MIDIHNKGRESYRDASTKVVGRQFQCYLLLAQYHNCLTGSLTGRAARTFRYPIFNTEPSQRLNMGKVTRNTRTARVRTTSHNQLIGSRAFQIPKGVSAERASSSRRRLCCI